MASYLIEVPHAPKKRACALAAQAFLQTGSHFLANADWGCLDGDHRAWMTVDADSREQAESILPRTVRPMAKIVRLNRYTLQDVDEILEQHPA